MVVFQLFRIGTELQISSFRFLGAGAWQPPTPPPLPPRQIHLAAITHRSVTVIKWELNRSRCSQSQMVSHSCCCCVCNHIHSHTFTCSEIWMELSPVDTHPLSKGGVWCRCWRSVSQMYYTACHYSFPLYWSLWFISHPAPLLCVNPRGAYTHTHTICLSASSNVLCFPLYQWKVYYYF